MDCRQGKLGCPGHIPRLASQNSDSCPAGVSLRGERRDELAASKRAAPGTDSIDNGRSQGHQFPLAQSASPPVLDRPLPRSRAADWPSARHYAELEAMPSEPPAPSQSAPPPP